MTNDLRGLTTGDEVKYKVEDGDSAVNQVYNEMVLLQHEKKDKEKEKQTTT